MEPKSAMLIIMTWRLYIYIFIDYDCFKVVKFLIEKEDHSKTDEYDSISFSNHSKMLSLLYRHISEQKATWIVIYIEFDIGSGAINLLTWVDKVSVCIFGVEHC